MDFGRRKVRRVIVVDDSRTMQALMETAFNARSDFRVVGVASDATTAADLVRRLVPDLVSIDLCMPYLDGANLLEMLANLPRVCKIIVSDQTTRSMLLTNKLEALGASTCLGKRELTDSPDAFFQKINAACDRLAVANKLRSGPSAVVPPPAPTRPVTRAPVVDMGFPVPTDEGARLDILRRKQLADAVRDRQFDQVTRHVSAVTGLPICLMTFIDRDTQWLKSSFGLEPGSMPRAHAFCAHTIAQAETFVVPNATLDPRFVGNPLVTGDLHIRTYAGHPIAAADGTRLGALCILDVKPRQVTPAMTFLLASMAEIVGEMIERRPALVA